MASNKRNNDPSDITFHPGRVSRLAVQVVEQRRKDPDGGLLSGIADLDRVMLPMRPGELIPVLGNTSNYKSGVMNYIARYNAARIQPDENRVVVKVTWEQSVEEDTLAELAYHSGISVTKMARGIINDGEWETIQAAAIKRLASPIWIVGHSMLASGEKRKRRPGLTMSDVALALEYIADDATDYPLKIDLVVLDYLQRIHLESEESTREGYMHIVDRAKDAALAFGCPVLLGVQAKREVQDRTWKLPALRDGLETSNIEQSADKFLSVWMPKTTEIPGSQIEGPGGKLEVTENLLLMGLLKQKLGEAPRMFALFVDPSTNQIGGLQLRDLNAA